MPISLTVFSATEIEQQNFQGVESYFARHAERQLHVGRHARSQGIVAARHQRSALARQQHQGRQLRILHRRVQRGAGHLQSGNRRHRSDRSAARTAGHLLRPQRRRRRHQHHHQAADQRLLRGSERAVLELQHGRHPRHPQSAADRPSAGGAHRGAGRDQRRQHQERQSDRRRQQQQVHLRQGHRALHARPRT